MKWRLPSRTCPPASRPASCTELPVRSWVARASNGVISLGKAKAPCVSFSMGSKNIEKMHY